MKTFLKLIGLSTSLILFAAAIAHADCDSTTTTGVGYYGAKTNCEVILRGQANSCQPEQPGPNGLWACQCLTNCTQPTYPQPSYPQPSYPQPTQGNHTVTTGVGYYGAKGNCEMILKGTASNCQPQQQGPNALWSCSCDY